MSRNWTPSIVPTASGDAQTIYLVVNNFRHLGTAFTETDVEQTDLETVITDLMSGQYIDPVRVVAFNTAEHWALILLAMPCPHQSKHSLRRTPARHVNCHCDSTRCHGIKSFFDPIVIDGKTLRTLRDAARYITKLPKAEHDADEWQAAMQALLLVAEHDGPPMFARIGVMRALNRGHVREFDISRKDHHWGQRKLALEQ